MDFSSHHGPVMHLWPFPGLLFSWYLRKAYKNSSEPVKAFILDLARILKTRVKIRDEIVCYVIFVRTWCSATPDTAIDNGIRHYFRWFSLTLLALFQAKLFSSPVQCNLYLQLAIFTDKLQQQLSSNYFILLYSLPQLDHKYLFCFLMGYSRKVGLCSLMITLMQRKNNTCLECNDKLAYVWLGSLIKTNVSFLTEAFTGSVRHL